MNTPYPAFLRLAGRRCVVVGGGAVAKRKVLPLVDSEASVVVIAPAVSATIQALASEGRLAIEERRYRRGDLVGAFLAFAATDDPAVNAEVAAEGRAVGALVNSADDPTACDFIVPASVRRGDVTVAISTRGRSPSFARQLRQELEAWLTSGRVELLDLLGGIRRELQSNGRNPGPERWRRAIDADVVRAIEAGNRLAARERLLEALGAAPSGSRQD